MSNKYRGSGSKGRLNGLAEKYLINTDIKANEVLFIGLDGEKQGVIPIQQALDAVAQDGVDLVQVGINDSVVITKAMDFGKFLYSKKKQLSDAKKQHKVIQVKEIKMRPNIGDQDYKTKMKHAIGFLKDGKKVKFTLQFRGRQMIVKNELGQKMFDRIKNDIAEEGFTKLIEEKDQRHGPFWTKIYFVK